MVTKGYKNTAGKQQNLQDFEAGKLSAEHLSGTERVGAWLRLSDSVLTLVVSYFCLEDR